MPRIRPELVRGLSLLGIFFVVIISSSILSPYAIKQSEYVVVGIERLKQNPVPFEGENISAQVTVTSVLGNGTYIITEKEVEAILIVPTSLGSLENGVTVYIRGTSWVQTNNSIIVHEFYILDYSSSLIRSAPGIILFIVLFFSAFVIDLKQLAFVRRKKQNA